MTSPITPGGAIDGGAHTPGPWVVDAEYISPASNLNISICAIDRMDAGGPKSWFFGPTTNANARLIAAAPDLLAALLRCKFDSLNMSLADLAFCRAAVAKATAAPSSSPLEKQ